MDKITADLKGADFNERLVWKTGEEFNVMPFYRRGDIENLNYVDSFLPLYLRGGVRQPADRRVHSSPNSWLIRQNIKVTDYSAANKKAHINPDERN